MAGSRVIRFHFFPERRGIREAMVVSSTPTSRFSDCRCACHRARLFYVDEGLHAR